MEGHVRVDVLIRVMIALPRTHKTVALPVDQCCKFMAQSIIFAPYTLQVHI
jgi:hypothetical protein